MNTNPPMNDEHVWKQMLQYLDGTLPDADVEELNGRLKADIQLRELFEDLILQQIKLKEIAQEQQATLDAEAEARLVASEENIIRLTDCSLITDLVMKEEERKVANRMRVEKIQRHFRLGRFPAGLAAAACLTLIGVALWFLLMPAKLATLVMVDPGVIVERGNSKLNAEPMMTLRVGDRLVTPESGRAMFSYLNEPTEVTVHSRSSLGVDLVRESKQLTLDRGAFVADVARQDPEHPLSLVTPQAGAIVVGTRFKLSTADTSTKLEVFEGAVRIMQSLEGPSMQVPAGHYVEVEPGLPVSLMRLPSTRGGVQLEHWKGEQQQSANTLTLNQLMFSGVGVTPGSSRVRGYLHPPLSGAYRFQLNANTSAELRLSESAKTTESKAIAVTESLSGANVSSEVVMLRAGQRYYFELNCDPAESPANFTISWTMPGGSHRVVYGEYLSPFETGLE